MTEQPVLILGGCVPLSSATERSPGAFARADFREAMGPGPAAMAKRIAELEAENARLREAVAYQERVHQHFRYVAGDDVTDMPERRDRAGEEHAELQQALGQTLEGYIAIGRYVWGRPAGDAAQEMGGTLNTLAALAAWAGLDMMACGEAELARTMRPEIIAKIRHKRSNRHGRGPLPGDDADLVTTNPTKTPGERPMTFLPDGWGGGEWVDRQIAWPTPADGAD